MVPPLSLVLHKVKQYKYKLWLSVSLFTELSLNIEKRYDALLITNTVPMYPAFKSKSVIITENCTDIFNCYFLMPPAFTRFSHLLLFSLSVRNMDLLPEGAGEEICQWEKRGEHTHWAHIRLWLWWCQGLHWEDKRVSKWVVFWEFFASNRSWVFKLCRTLSEIEVPSPCMRSWKKTNMRCHVH